MTIRPATLVSRGLITGLLGAATVAAWFLAVDLYTGRPFRTPAALGSALFLGASAPEHVQVGAGIVAAYTVVHLVAFALAGIAFVALAQQVQRSSSLVLLTVPAAIVLEAGALIVLALGAEWVLGALGVTSVLLANLFAVCSMGWYVWRTHPMLGHGGEARVISAVEGPHR
jgi:hypothetical protein